MDSASVDERRGTFFVIPYYRAVTGVYVKKGPIRTVESPDAFQIGTRVLNALGEFEDGLPMPDWTTYRSPLYEAAGVRNWNEYVRGLSACAILRDQECLTVTPQVRPRGEQGLVELMEAKLRLSRHANAEEIGKAVLDALSTSRAANT